MNNFQRDKHLALEMGWYYDNILIQKNEYNYLIQNWLHNPDGVIQYEEDLPNFSTPDGFFYLWNWATTQCWFLNFCEMNNMVRMGYDCNPYVILPQKFVNPDELANLLYKYLS